MSFKKSHNMHMFFFLVYSTLGPMSSLDTVFKFTVSQWDHTSSMVGHHHDHVSTASSQKDCVSQSTLSPRLHDNLVNRCGCRFSSHSSQLSETKDVSGNSLLKNIWYFFMSDITCRFMCVFFFVPCLQQRSETNSEVVYSNRTWVQSKMQTAAAGDCR